MAEKFRTNKWFVSSWNYEEEITKNFKFQKDIEIHDVTLRDGEQQAGLAMNKDDKVRIVEKLAEIGVHRVEAGMPAVSPQDKAAIKEIVGEKFGPKIFAFGRCMKQDVELAAECGVDGIVIEIPSSGHIIKNAYKWPLEKAIDLSIEATTLAKKLGLYTVFFPIDGSRADIEWFLDLITKVSEEGHMDALVAVDTFGGLSPHAAQYMVKETRKRIGNKPLELHFHEDFNLGVANTIVGLSEGANVAHTTIAGIGERAGNVPYEALVLSLLTMYGIDLGIKTEKMYGLAKFLREITGMPIRPNTPIIGDTLNDIESGIIAGWYRNCYEMEPLELSPISSELVGQRSQRIILGKNSGLPSIEIYLGEKKLSMDDEQKNDFLQMVKNSAMEKRRALNDVEVDELVNKILS